MMDPTWRGPSAGIKYLLPAIFLISLICWAISLSFFVDLVDWPLEQYTIGGYPLYRVRPSAVSLFFYLTCLPMATFLAALIDFFLLRANHLYPPISITWSIISLGAWLYMLLMWGMCEYSTDTAGDPCPRFWSYDLTAPGKSESMMYGFNGSWRYYTRLLFGTMACAAAIVQLSLASVAVDEKRKEAKKRRRAAKYGEVAGGEVELQGR